MILPPDFNPNDADVALLPSEIDRLRAQIDTWPKKSKQEKAARREELITEFLNVRKLDTTNPWARGYLRGKISLWLSNHSGSRDARLPKALKCMWSGRDVFNITEDTRILERKNELIEKGKVPIAALNIARSELWNELTDDEQTEFEETAEEWNEKGPDNELRAQIAEKRLGDWIQAIILWIHDQCGAMGRFEFCVLDKKEEMVHGIHDVSMIWHATDRKVPTYEQWRAKHPKRTWQQYCHACYHPDEHQDDADAPRATLPPHEFTFFDDGTPVLPPMESFRHGTIMKVVLHTYLSLHWEAASGIKNEPVAWKAVAKNTANFLPPDALPDEFVFQNPMRMSVDSVQELWKHIIDLQSAGETWSDRFHWTHWWKRLGRGEDAGERLEVAYGRAPRPKHIAESKRKGQAAKNQRVPPQGAFGLSKRNEDSTDPEDGGSTEEDGQTKANGGKKKKNPAKKPGPGRKGGEPQNTKTKQDPKGKGKARATDDSDSAKSSGVGSEGEDDPSLQSEGSAGSEIPDSGQEENFDMDIPSTDVGGVRIAGPSRKPLPKPRPVPKRKAAAGNPPDLSPEPSHKRSAGGPPEPSPDDTPGPEDLPHIPGPWDDAPVGPNGLGSGRIPPRRALVEAATGQPPSWVANDPERVLPFLWSLSTEDDYRAYLKSWRHMLRRRSTLREPQVSQWANWDSDCWGVPSHFHINKDNWGLILRWISDNAPTPITSCSDVQQWGLVVGLALRDIYTGNDVDPDPEEPVPYGGPDYLRFTKSSMLDAVNTILPLCLTSQHPGLPITSISQNLASSVPLSRKEKRIMGKRGAPPGVRAAPLATKRGGKAKAAAPAPTSADEVELAVTANLPSTTGSSVSRSRKPPTCFVELPPPASRRRSAAPAHQEPPTDVAMQEEDAPVPAPAPLRRSSRKRGTAGK